MSYESEIYQCNNKIVSRKKLISKMNQVIASCDGALSDANSVSEITQDIIISGKPLNEDIILDITDRCEFLKQTALDIISRCNVDVDRLQTQIRYLQKAQEANREVR